MILTTVVVAVALGIAAQILAERLKLPAILPLLVLGVLVGPELWALLGVGLPGLIHPEALGEGLEVLIHLGIALILFEGGLSLDPRHLRQVGSAVRNLLSIGVAVTGVGAAWAFRAVLDMPWGTAALFGAIVTVTGPTVISPLLRHMIVPRRVSTILVSEGLIIDPIGAVLAYLVLQAIQRPAMASGGLLGEMLWLAFIGSVYGFAAGSAAKLIIGSRRAGGELRNLTILALLLLAYLLAERQAPQSGILVAVVMGFTMSAADIPDLVRLRAFKSQLTVLLISVLFILLAAQLDLGAVVALGWRGLVVVAALVLVVRPVSVFLSVPPRQLDLKGRLVLALTAPRGIVAAAVASLAARELTDSGIAGGPTLEGMVYLTIILTVLWATAMAVVLPQALGFTRDPRRRLTVLVGAHAVSAALARALRRRDRAVAVIDSSPAKLAELEDVDVRVVRGDARDAASFEQAGVQRDTQVVAATTNDELNLLVAELVRDEFGVEHPVVALHQPPEELGTVRRAWVDLLGGGALDLDRWIRRFENGAARMVSVDLGREGARQTVARLLEREDGGGVLPVFAWRSGAPAFRLGDEELDLERQDVESLTLMVSEAPERLRKFLGEAEESDSAVEHGPGAGAGSAGAGGEREGDATSEPAEEGAGS